jgi:hypothetical protein
MFQHAALSNDVPNTLGSHNCYTMWSAPVDGRNRDVAAARRVEKCKHPNVEGAGAMG